MARIAVIDCGTNTFNLLIAEADSVQQTVQRLFSTRIPVKLGQQGINKGFIAFEPYQRGLEALKVFHQHIEQQEVTSILAFATSAIRDAQNGDAFIEDARNRYAISIQKIDGNEEARLIYEGNKRAVQLNEELSLIMDIGGGSTEFILCNANQIFWKQSFQLGAARLLDKFQPSDPITLAEQTAIYDYLKTELQPLTHAIQKLGLPHALIGSSGAFDSVIEMIHFQFGGEPLSPSKTEYTINIPYYQAIANQLIASTTQQRRQMPGLLEMRVDMMVISCLLMNVILQTYPIPTFKASSYSLKEGALFSFLENKK